MDLNLGNAIGRRTTNAKIILSAPTCPAENPTNDFFIKINELPQITDRVNNITIDKYFGFLSMLFIYMKLP